MNSKDEFNQPGDIVPTLEGAGRNPPSSRPASTRETTTAGATDNSRQLAAAPAGHNSSDSCNNSDVERVSQEVGREKRNKKGVTGSGVQDGGEGVTTLTRARRENIVV